VFRARNEKPKHFSFCPQFTGDDTGEKFFPLGARTLERVLGFEEFIRRVESDRFKRMITEPEQFEKLLPFTMASSPGSSGGGFGGGGTGGF